MKKSKFNETKILAILKEAEAGMTVAEISRKYGVSNGTFYNWKSKYARHMLQYFHTITSLSLKIVVIHLFQSKFHLGQASSFSALNHH
ncbi:MAG TPA: hypothetical protein ENH94_04045 [Phycisphaerales bacterium]|nr:hypothetical protein [Phycisphaerales bacterium]